MTVHSISAFFPPSTGLKVNIKSLELILFAYDLCYLAIDAGKDVSRNTAIRKDTLGPHIKRKGNNQKIKRNKNTLRGKRKLIDRWLKIRRIRLKRKLKRGRNDGLKRRGSCLALTCVDTAVGYLRL